MQRFLSIALIVVGLGFVMIGLLAGLFYLGLPVVSPEANYDLLQVNTVAIALMAVCGLGGGLLAWAGWRRYSGAAARLVRLPHPLWFVLLFVATLALGEATLRTSLAPWVFPPLHVLASVAPPLFFLTLAAAQLDPARRGFARRDVAVQLGGGSLLATSFALLSETTLLGALGLMAFLIVSATPGGAERLQTLATQLSQGDLLNDPAFLQSLFSSPLVLVGAVLGVGVAAPLIEEFAKGFGVFLMGTLRRRLTVEEAFLWGTAAGAGFSITESLFNGVATLPVWAGPLTLRAATAAVHCLAAALMGLAWQAWFSGERRWRLGAYLALAATVHGLWNLVAVLIAFLATGGALNANLLMNAGSVLLSLALVGLFVINSGLFVFLSRRLGQQAEVG